MRSHAASVKVSGTNKHGKLSRKPLTRHGPKNTEMEGIRRELARHLSSENQNVVNGDVIGMARDLAQVKVTSMDNAKEAMQQLDAAEVARAQLAQTLDKINAIRNSIISMQTINW